MKSKSRAALSERKRFQFYQRLKDKKASLLGTKRLIERGERGEFSGEAIGETAHFRLHDADLASDESMRDISAKLAQGEIQEIQEIEDALSRIDKGTFGKCEECEEPISEARLTALPQARLCIDCEERREFIQRRSGRPSIEKLDNGVIYKREYSKKGFQ